MLSEYFEGPAQILNRPYDICKGKVEKVLLCPEKSEEMLHITELTISIFPIDI
jgi:hypothetical protein